MTDKQNPIEDKSDDITEKEEVFYKKFMAGESWAQQQIQKKKATLNSEKK